MTNADFLVCLILYSNVLLFLILIHLHFSPELKYSSTITLLERHKLQKDYNEHKGYYKKNTAD